MNTLTSIITNPITVVIGIPGLIIAVSVLVEGILERRMNREHWILGKDFALASLALYFVSCLEWAQQYVEAGKQATDYAAAYQAGEPLPDITVIPPEGLTLALYFAGALFSGFMLLVVMLASGSYMRNKEKTPRPDPVISYGGVININLWGILPLIISAAFLADLL